MRNISLSFFTLVTVFIYTNNNLEQITNTHLKEKINLDKSQYINARRELNLLIKNNKRI